MTAAPHQSSGRFTPERIAAAHAETDRLSRELDITNPDHIALWLEANIDDANLAFLACRIVEAHEAAIAASTPEQYNRICANIRAKAVFRGEGV